MTSANLSLGDRVKNRTKYITRTLWISILAFIVMAIYYIFGVIMMVTRAINFANNHGQSLSVLQYEKYNAVTKIMGFEQFGFIIVMVIAMAFAFQGFSYLFDSRKIDFYLSQPTTRAQRLKKNYFDAITTFVVIYLFVEIVALIAAAIMGAVNSVVLVSVLLETVRTIIFFLTIYNLTVLAIMLSGSLPISMLVMLFFILISFVLGMELILYKELFYATYSAYSKNIIVASPLYDRITVMHYLVSFARKSQYNLSMEPVKTVLSVIWKRELDIFVVGLVSFVLVIFLSRFRRAEHAGKTVVYKPFRWFVKMISCIVIGLAAGYMVHVVYSDMWNNRVFLMMFAVMMIAVFLSGCFIEVIMEGNIRKFLSGKCQTIMAACVVALTFFIFRGDLLGYDSYVPKASTVESCAILDDDYSFEFRNYDDYENDFDSSVDSMYITDVDNFIKVVKPGMAERKDYYKKMLNGFFDSYRSDVQVLFRLKNGKSVYRTITIPAEFDTTALAKIVDSEEYKTGYFKVFHDDSLREFDKIVKPSRKEVKYVTSTSKLMSSKLPYDELSDAYRKDVLNSFTYEMAEKTSPIGRIEYDADTSNAFASFSLNVFENYTNTIELLKKYGIYSDDKIDVEYIDSIVVGRYYYDDDDWDDSDETASEEYENNVKYHTYTDKNQIQQILDASHCSDYYSRWYNSSKYDISDYSVEIITKDKDYIYNSFETGKVPGFVITDTAK